MKSHAGGECQYKGGRHQVIFPYWAEEEGYSGFFSYGKSCSKVQHDLFSLAGEFQPLYVLGLLGPSANFLNPEETLDLNRCQLLLGSVRS